MKHSLILLFCAIATMSVKAQTTDQIIAIFDKHRVPNSRQAETGSILLDAVRPALSIVRQQYRLERNGEFFGRKGKQYYGETYTLGVKVSGSTILQRGVVLPWENDADYKRLQESGKYTASMFLSMQRQLTGDDWNVVDFDFENLTKVKTADSLMYESLDKISDFGLPVDETEGYKKGFMIWAYCTTHLQDSTMQVVLKQVDFGVEAKGNDKPVSMNPENTDSLLGGIFVVPQVERAGYIKVLLMGVAAKDPVNDWQLELLTQTSEGKNGRKPDKAKEAKNREKAPKETPDDLEPTPIE